jgi:hypothetical protein
VKLLLASVLSFAEDGVERPGPGQAPSAFRIWKAGRHVTDKGDAILTAEAAEGLMLEQSVRGNLYSIDVDHMSLSPTAPVESRKAVGWHRLELRADANGEPELWAVDVQWTDAVRAGLEKDPPEWRYFSPAYAVNKKTREVESYTNTALTNNPATWQVTALATIAAATTPKDSQMKVSKDVAAALRAMAEGDDETAKAAKVLCGMLEEPGDDEKKASEGDDKPKDDEKKDEPKDTKASEGDDKPKDDEKKEATKVAASNVDLARRVHELEADRAKEKDDAEREKLFASRPDFSKEVRDTLATVSLDVLRKACKTWKRGVPAEGGTVRDAQAATQITATRGAEQGKAQGLPSEESRVLKVRMGLATEETYVKHEANASIFHALPADAAKRMLAKKGEVK